MTPQSYQPDDDQQQEQLYHMQIFDPADCCGPFLEYLQLAGLPARAHSTRASLEPRARDMKTRRDDLPQRYVENYPIDGIRGALDLET